MQRNGRWTLLLIDVVGGFLVACCVACLLWLSVFRNRDATTEINELSRMVHSVKQGLASTRHAHKKQTALLQEHREELSKTGQLPQTAPVEEYFQMLANLASLHSLDVLRHHPTTSRRYPGLLEQRFVYEVSGSGVDLVRFLRAIEDTQYWADVSHFKIEGGSVSLRSAGRKHRARLTLSLFSADSLPTLSTNEQT